MPPSPQKISALPLRILIPLWIALSHSLFLSPSPAESGLESFPAWSGSQLEGTGSQPMPYVAVPAFAGIPWDNPICMERVPNTTRFLVVERWGTVWLLDSDKVQRSLFLQTGRKTGGDKIDRSITGHGVAFHPKFPKTPVLYLSWNKRIGDKAFNRLSRFEVTAENGDLRIDPASESLLLEWETNGHNGGDIHFGADGFLYMSSGDGSSPGDPNNVGQTTDNLLGSILRIDVENSTAEKPYSIPNDNPYIDVAGIRPEVWAYGLRNPWRMKFRPGTNELWLGDNGDEQWELVHRIGRGANYGWSTFEGSHPFRPSNKLAGPNPELTPPVVEHPHTEMRSVIGGLWYRGSNLPALENHYLYACYFTGKIWGFGMKGDKATKPSRLADSSSQVVSFAETADREVLIVTMDKGIFRLEKAPDVAVQKPIPQLLSETGLFASTENHQPAEGLLPYEINVPIFWDGSRRERYFGIPKEEGRIHIQKRPTGLDNLDPASLRTSAGLDRWQIPNKSTFLQTFLLGEGDHERKIETQISLKEGGEWRFLTYRWNDEQTDATLVPEDGETAQIAFGNQKRSWKFPARAECTTCHTQRSMFVPGFTLGQLNRKFDYAPLGGKPANQIATFHHLGFFRNHFKLPPQDKMPPMPDPSDESLPLQDRARSYLHVNCAHCHRETGVGGRASFELLHWLQTADLGLIDARPLVGLPGIDPLEARLIKPGDPEKSEIYRRMIAPEFGRMPLLGGQHIDRAGAKLIRRWIESMPKFPPG